MAPLDPIGPAGVERIFPDRGGVRSRVLLAEDDADMREGVRQLLAERHEVVTAVDGEAALAAARDQPPDLVLADVRMPRLDGLSLLHQLRKDPRTATVPVILLSARAGEEARIEGLQLGADDYLVKPFSPRELLARVDAHLELARMRRAAQDELRRARDELETRVRERTGELEDSLRALRASEQRYRNLFESIDDGFCVVEVLFDAAGRPADYRFLEVNPAFVAQTGLHDAVGRRMRELAPAHEEHWFETYGRISRTGEPERFESRAAALHRWYSVFAFRVGEPSQRRVAVLFHDITDRRRTDEELRRARDALEAWVAERTAELARANEQLRAEVRQRERAEDVRTDLLRKLSRAQEDERRRVARDLHDSVGQLLAGLSLAVKAVSAAGPLPSPATTRLGEVQRLADELGRQVHTLALQLRPTALDDLGLTAALGQLVGEWSAQAEVPVDFQTAGLDEERLPAEVETVLYRMVQEALTNVAKHARARQVSVVVSRHDGHATAAVEDDGLGFDPETAGNGRLGLVGMRERVAMAGGELDVESIPGAGTTVIARVPTGNGEGRDSEG
ncbi:response regulator [Sorangium sp. So ce260]|uniref:ATP-binding response regulator n=1 Tax=Sorangium sp. So ce260 TaxID=3133291 RepID=UPI003F60C97E